MEIWDDVLTETDRAVFGAAGWAGGPDTETDRRSW